MRVFVQLRVYLPFRYLRACVCACALSATMFVAPLPAQIVSGRVTDGSGEALPSVNVSIPALHTGTVTDDEGRYSMGPLGHGIYTVQFSLIGYIIETRSVSVEAGDIALDIVLTQSPLELQGVIVTGKPQPTDALSSPQPVTSVEGHELERSRGQALMQSLEGTPGVTTLTTGAGIAKPVIRGMTSQRVLVMSDGSRQEGQQWGDEHGPEIDAFDVEKLEVLRGPGSVLYGAEAMGGVVNVIRRRLPSSDEGAPALEGRMTLNGFSNNESIGGNISLSGASGMVGYRANLSGRSAGDVNTPDGRLFNSGLSESGGGGTAGVTGDWGTVSLGYSGFAQTLEIHEDPAEDPAATPYQKARHDRVRFHGDLHLEPMKIEIDGNWQENNRREFEEASASAPAMHLRLNTSTLEFRGHHHPLGPLFGTVGISGMRQLNATLAEEKLIPGYTMSNLAAYLFEEATLGPVNLSMGLRYDSRVLDVEETPELNVAAQERTYDAFTGTAGVVVRLTDPLAVRANVGSGWRAPAAFELFIDGVHEGTGQYLIGDPALETESSVNTDIGLTFASTGMQGELTWFRNSVESFIHESPTGEVDSASGEDIYLLRQGDALLNGVEFSLQGKAAKWLILSGGFDYTRGELREPGTPLPRMPAARTRGGMKFVLPEEGIIGSPYISLNVTGVLEQDRIADHETATPGYVLVALGAGAMVRAGETVIDMDITADNLFDKAYADHLSRYKDYALNMGRNVSLRLSVPVTVIQ